MKLSHFIVFILTAFFATPMVGEEKRVDTRSSEKTWVEIHTPIDDSYRLALETRSSVEPLAWETEIRRHYRTDGKLVYRGVCNDTGLSLTDVLHMFVTFDPNLMSKSTGRGYWTAAKEKSPFDVRRSIHADLSRYNEDAYLYTLSREVNIHQRGPIDGNKAAYGASYGMSTTWSFWMAAEFAGVYPGDKKCANSVLFGMYPAQHFIDYANLEAVDSSFKRFYPDEREVLGVGAVDPDALMLIARMEKRDDGPTITDLLLRNPTNPAEILYFTGGVDTLQSEVERGWMLLQQDESAIDATFRRYGVRPPTPPSVPPDSEFRVPLAKLPTVHRDGRPLQPTKILALDYDAELFPPLVVPPNGSETSLSASSTTTQETKDQPTPR